MNNAAIRVMLRTAVSRPALVAALASALLAAVGWVTAQLALPLVVARIIDHAIVQKSESLLFSSAGLLVTVALLSVACKVVHKLAFTSLTERTLVEIRSRLLERLQAMPTARYERRDPGAYSALFSDDAPAVSRVWDPTIGEALLGVVQLLALVWMIVAKYGNVAWVVVVLLPTYIALPVFIGPRMRRAARELADARAEAQRCVQETLQGVREIKVLTREEWALDRCRRLWTIVTRRQFHHAATDVAYSVAYVGYWAAAAFVYWYGGRQVVAGTISIGQLIALVWLLGMLDVPTNRLVAAHAQFQAVRASADRLEPYLRPDRIEQGDQQLRAGPLRIELRDASVTYAMKDRRAIRRVSLRIDPGMRLAIVGPSGAGKTTLVNALVRLCDLQEGAVLFDGVAVDRIAPASLRSRVAIVQQEPFLFAGSIGDNIALGRLGASRDEVERAARIADAHRFIEALPSKYDTLIGERGAQMSVGQKQRLAIARAVLRDPDVLILDEATSALDAESEHAVARAIEAAARGRTTIVIAHRLSTVQSADRIVVLDQGVVVAQGPHAELERQCELYARLVRLQELVPTQFESEAARALA